MLQEPHLAPRRTAEGKHERRGGPEEDPCASDEFGRRKVARRLLLPSTELCRVMSRMAQRRDQS